MANVASILAKAYRLTNKSAATFLDGNSTNILEALNTRYGHRILDILRVRVDKNASIEMAKTDLISASGLSEGDNGYNGEYAFPSDLLKPVRMEISYDGENYRPCEIYDINENHLSETTDVNVGFDQSRPFVRFERDSYFIRPVKETAGNITGGIRIWYEKRQTALTTDSPIFESNLHDILAYDLAEEEYIMHSEKYSDTQYGRFQRDKEKIEAKFENFYKNRLKHNMRFKSKQENYN